MVVKSATQIRNATDSINFIYHLMHSLLWLISSVLKLKSFKILAKKIELLLISNDYTNVCSMMIQIICTEFCYDFFKVNSCRLRCIFQLHSESFKLRRHFNGEFLGGVCNLASSSLRVKEGILCVEGVAI